MIMAADKPNISTELGLWMCRQARAPRLRTMREFAEQELIIPDGPHEGRRYRIGRQPFSGLWLDSVDSGKWNRFVTTGPTQSGKTLLSCALPTMYHLFEIQENVVFGLPAMDMAADKWSEDLLPAIEASRFREYLPKSGPGSKGGMPTSIRFRNGATLRFVTGGGSDKKRAGFTSRVVVITETDGMDEQGMRSREADKITQIEARTRAYGADKRVYMECTVSTEEGRTWRELKAGTDSRIIVPCPHCGEWITPEREHLIGWMEADDSITAGERAAFVCCECGSEFTDKERITANHAARLVHKGQSVTGTGEVEGVLPRTMTLGFRWNAFNNLFVTAGNIGAEEWVASQRQDEDNAEREMRQFVWAIPHEPERVDISGLNAPRITKQVAQHGQGIIPEWAETVTVGVDVGKWLMHWLAIAWKKDSTGHVIDYGRHEVPSDRMSEERAIMLALHGLREEFDAGWLFGDTRRRPDQVWIDAGYQTTVVRDFSLDAGLPYRAVMGFGANQFSGHSYREPRATGSVVVHIGDHYHIVKQKPRNAILIEIDADYWKTYAHQRLTTPTTEVGTMTLYQAHAKEHLSLAKHLSAETMVEEFQPKKGLVYRWERVSKSNHWLDAMYMACAAGHIMDVRAVGQAVEQQSQKPKRKRKPVRTPDDRPFLVTNR